MTPFPDRLPEDFDDSQGDTEAAFNRFASADRLYADHLAVDENIRRDVRAYALQMDQIEWQGNLIKETSKERDALRRKLEFPDPFKAELEDTVKERDDLKYRNEVLEREWHVWQERSAKAEAALKALVDRLEHHFAGGNVNEKHVAKELQAAKEALNK